MRFHFTRLSRLLTLHALFRTRLFPTNRFSHFFMYRYKMKLEIDIFIVFQGNLALSRALGDFCFKKNVQKPAEEQIVTGN